MTNRKYRRSWRWYVNAALFIVGDWCHDLSAWVSQYEPPSESELEQSSMRIIALVNSRLEHPCPTCAGRGLVYLDSDDTAVCYACAGHGVDVGYLARKEN